MSSRRLVAIARWALAFAALAGIVVVYRRWLHVNSTTIALTLILYILLLAARVSVRLAVAVAIAATAVYNFYFLPPFGTLSISDPQNWIALLAFLATGIVGSRLSERARREAQDARRRQRELEVLFTLSRDLLQTDQVAVLLPALPSLIDAAARADAVLLYLLDGDRVYQSGLRQVTGSEIPRYRELALGLTGITPAPAGETQIPVRTGVRPRGLLLLYGTRLSVESLQAIGGLVSIAIDRAQALEEVARNEATKESERLRTLLLDSITHELRTPLTSIKGAASALLSTESVSEESRRELLTIVDEESDRLNRLVAQAVEMAQLEAREVQMHLAPVSVEDLVQRARTGCGWIALEHPLVIDLPTTLPHVAADKEMVSKVLCNLLENAAKYSAQGSTITVSAERRAEFVLTSVADRGMGIAAPEQALIFDRLYRSPARRGSTAGSGMGLAISRAIVESHGGAITVVSQPDRGSVFTFSLPIAT